MIKTQIQSRITTAIAAVAMLATVIGVGATSASAQVGRHRVVHHSVVVRRPIVVHHSYSSTRARLARERIARERRMAAMRHHHVDTHRRHH